MNCCEFFDSLREVSEPCKVLQSHPEAVHLKWETESASKHSPSPVGNDETLARQVVDPTHFDHVTGTIKPTFFDDASSIGASCHRTKYISDQAIFERTNSRVAISNQNPPKSGLKKAIGYAILTVSEIRSISTFSEPVRRGAAVYDTAKEDDISHADVCQLVPGRQDGKSVRAQLFMLARDRLVRFSAANDKAE